MSKPDPAHLADRMFYYLVKICEGAADLNTPKVQLYAELLAQVLETEGHPERAAKIKRAIGR